VAAVTTGRWQVTTETSVYLFDVDDRHVTRVPDAGAGAIQGASRVVVAYLRRDYERLPLIAIAQCKVGAPLRMVLDLRGDGIPTLRETTCVRDQRELPSGTTLSSACSARKASLPPCFSRSRAAVRSSS
jgi:hypothetical protein